MIRRKSSAASPTAMRGLSQQPSCWQPQIHVLRNQSVGSKWSVRSVGTAIGRRNGDQDVVWTGLGIFDLHVEIAVFIEERRYRAARTPARFGRAGDSLQPIGRREIRPADNCRVLQVGMGRRGVEVVSNTLSRPRRGFPRGFDSPNSRSLRIGSRPFHERDGEAESALAVGDAKQAVLAPAIGAAACLIVRKVAPAVAVRGIVLANGAPLPFGEIGSPAFPIRFAFGIRGKTFEFGAGSVGMVHRVLCRSREVVQKQPKYKPPLKHLGGGPENCKMDLRVSLPK